MKPLVTDEMLQAAFDYMHEGAQLAAQAKADRLLAEHRREKIFSELLLKAPGKSADQRRAWAKAHDDHWRACVVEAQCEKDLEEHRRRLVQAQAIVEAWRTESASARHLGRMG